jgi:hypothetical protein
LEEEGELSSEHWGTVEDLNEVYVLERLVSEEWYYERKGNLRVVYLYYDHNVCDAHIPLVLSTVKVEGFVYDAHVCSEATL